MSSKVLALAFCLLSLSLATRAQEGRPRQLIVPLAEGGFVAFQAETAFSEAAKMSDGQQARAVFDSQALVDDKQIIHRVLVDTEGKPIFGYDLFVQVNSTLKQFKITAGPLDPLFESKLIARGSNGQLPQPAPRRISTLPQSSDAQLLDDGDAFALDLLINANAGIKIVDVVKVSFDRGSFWNTVPKSLPRDFTLDAVELALKEYQLLLNGTVVATSKSTTGCAGALVWFYVPEHGRFIISLVPRDGYEFQKIGLVADNKIEFTVNGDHFEWISSAPVLKHGGAWNLWVLHDPLYTPLAFGREEATKKGKDPWDRLDAVVKTIKEDASKLRNQRQSTFEKNAEKPRGSARPVRVMVGSADRIENLWPK
jgi:hypothetical protein